MNFKVVLLVVALSWPSLSMALDSKTLRSADIVVEAVVTDVPTVDVLEVAPPIFHYWFRVSVTRNLKGTLPEVKLLMWSTRDEGDTIRKGDRLVLALRKIDQTLDGVGSRVHVIGKTRATIASVADAMTALEKQTKLGSDVTMSLAQVPPARAIKWTNPYGDGKFTLTIANSGRKAVAIPDVMALTNAAKVRVARGFRLEPGEVRTLTLDALPLDYAVLMGGGRLEVTFQTGDKSASSFFYYTDRFHGPMRKAARGQ